MDEVRSRWRLIEVALVGALILGLLVVTVAVHLSPTPRTTAEAVLRAHEELIEAIADRDVDAIMARLSSGAREAYDFTTTRWWFPEAEEFGVSRKEIEGKTSLETLELLLRRQAEKHAEYVAASSEAIRMADIRQIVVEDDLDRARVHGSAALAAWGGDEMIFHYVREEDGEWRCRQCGFFPTRWRTLENKVEAFLPKEPVDPSSVDAVVELLPGGLDHATRDLLVQRIRALRPDAPESLIVVLDARPGVTHGEVVRAKDALHVAGVRTVLFGEIEARKPGAGVVVNGVPLGESGEDVGPAEPATHPAVQRVLGLGRR